jgi:hypothetical protein
VCLNDSMLQQDLHVIIQHLHSLLQHSAFHIMESLLTRKCQLPKVTILKHSVVLSSCYLLSYIMILYQLIQL